MSGYRSEKIINEILNDLVTGKLGKINDQFITSRELALTKNVSLKTAFKIIQKIRDIGIIEKNGKSYKIISAIPKSNSKKRKMLLGFLAPCIDNPYFSKLATYAEEFVHSIGGSLIIASSNYNFETEKERLIMFKQQGVAGVMISPWASNKEEEFFYTTLNMPFVILGKKLEYLNCDSVLVNNYKATAKMAQHLIAQGIKEFAYIGNESKAKDFRFLGFKSELLENGFSIDDRNILRTNYNDIKKSDNVILQLLKQKRKSRLGIFCYHDLFATRVIHLCHELKIKVPEEISIGGFDDLPIASEIYPTLTTISYPIKDMARIAFESLYTQLQFGKSNNGIDRYLDSKLVIRKSSAIQNKMEI